MKTVTKESKSQKMIQATFDTLSEGKKKGLMQLYTQDISFNGKHVNIHGNRLKNFFSCSYLGLELDKEIIEGSVKAAQNYGTQFSASRGYVSCGLYDELESLLEKLFGALPIVSASTTLGHMNNIPLLVGDNDCVLYDWQVHASVQSALDHIRVRGVEVKFVKHNDMDHLEELITELQFQYDKIWYCCDGVYSMFGDITPVKKLNEFMEMYSNFHVYADDAHGMSVRGKHGRGYFLENEKLHDKAVLVTSLAKAFGVTGGVTLVNSPDLQNLLRTCGKSLIFSGPLTPPVLGACIASAKLHLSKEFAERQELLKKRIAFTNYLMTYYDLPVFFETDSPICFVGVGKQSVGYNLMKRLFTDKNLVNIAIYPAVSPKNTGIRFTINLHQTEDDILGLIRSLAHNLEIALAEEGYSRAQLLKDFRIEQKKYQNAIVTH